MALTQQLEYICPGETHAISYAVHLSRMSSFYPKCRECPLRCETGHLSHRLVDKLQRSSQRATRDSLFTEEGIRGVYLNELNRAQAGKYAAAFARLLWDETPFVGRREQDPPHTARRYRQTVVVGYDDRPASPDIFTGVTAALRRMGCEVIDIGRISKPCFRFTVGHLSASGGIYITGDGLPPSWTGLDFVAEEGRPLSKGGTSLSHQSLQAGELCVSLGRIEKSVSQSIGRSTRNAGQQRTFQAHVPYQAGLWKHFHELRRLNIVVGYGTTLVAETLTILFEKLQCRLHQVSLPRRVRDFTSEEDTDVMRIGKLVRRSNADFGLLIDDDGQRCGFVDERGMVVAPRIMTHLLADHQLSEQPNGNIVLEEAGDIHQQTMALLPESSCYLTLPRHEMMYATMQRQNAIFGGGNSGYNWFRTTQPACDAMLTLAKVLTVLSKRPVSFSDMIRVIPNEPITDQSSLTLPQ